MIRLRFFLWLLFMAGVPLTAQALEYGGLGGRPAYPDPAIPASRNWFVYSLPAGQVKEDAVVVSNPTQKPASVLVYPADTTHSSDGGFSLKQLSETMTGVGSWIRLFPDPRPDFARKTNSSIPDWCGPNFDGTGPAAAELNQADQASLVAWCAGKPMAELVIPAATEMTIPFTISVPAVAAPGDYTGGLIIQNQLPKPEAGQSGIQLATRVGVRLYETVPGQVTRELQISQFQLAASKPGWYTVTLGVTNPSSVSLDHVSRISIRNRLTGKTQTIERPGQALRDDELVINFPLRRPYLGWLDLHATVRYEGESGPVILTSNQLMAVTIHPSLWGILAGLGLLGLAAWWWRRRGRATPIRTYVVAGNDDLTGVARRFHVSWKRIAALNRLNAPYHITRGQLLKIPVQTGKASNKKK